MIAKQQIVSRQIKQGTITYFRCSLCECVCVFACMHALGGGGDSNHAKSSTPVSSFAEDKDLSILVPNNDRHSLPFAGEIQQVEKFVLPELTKIC